MVRSAGARSAGETGTVNVDVLRDALFPGEFCGSLQAGGAAFRPDSFIAQQRRKRIAGEFRLFGIDEQRRRIARHLRNRSRR